MQTTEANDVKTEKASPEATAELQAAMKAGKVRRGFRSVEEVVAAGIAAGEKDPGDGPHEQEEPNFMPDRIDIHVPDAGEPDAPAAVAAAEEPAAEEPEPAAAAPAKRGSIKIGERYFENQDEALAYAEELERQQLANDAFRQGIEAAQNLAPSNSFAAPQAAPAEPEKIPDEYYTDPAGYFKNLRKQIKDELISEVDKIQTAKQKHEQTMNEFWSAHPDLAKNEATRTLTGYVFNENFQALKNVDKEKALKIIGEKARARLKDLGVTTLPTKVMPPAGKAAASAGGAPGPARQKAPEKQLNFIQQLSEAKRKKAAARQTR